MLPFAQPSSVSFSELYEDCDDRFAFIAGYTDGGAPYGVMWEKVGIDLGLPFELGHDQLHRNMAKTTPIHEFMLYDMKSKPEYEANIVAAEILMDSDEVLRYIYEYGYTAEQIASAMSTDINLVALKVAHLATLGYNLHALEHKSNFLK